MSGTDTKTLLQRMLRLRRVAKFKQAKVELPPPRRVNTETFIREIRPNLERSLTYFAGVGVKLQEIDSQDWDQYAKFTFKNYRFSVDFGDLVDLDRVEWVTQRWDDLMEVVEHFEGIPNPLYDNLDSVLGRKMGRAIGLNLARSWVVQMVRSTGKRWT